MSANQSRSSQQAVTETETTPIYAGSLHLIGRRLTSDHKDIANQVITKVEGFEGGTSDSTVEAFFGEINGTMKRKSAEVIDKQTEEAKENVLKLLEPDRRLAMLMWGTISEEFSKRWNQTVTKIGTLIVSAMERIKNAIKAFKRSKALKKVRDILKEAANAFKYATEWLQNL